MDNRVGIKFGKSLIFNIFAPSLGATSGFSWVSINKPLTPIAHAALDKEGINCLSPPDFSPSILGCCTESVSYTHLTLPTTPYV